MHNTDTYKRFNMMLKFDAYKLKTELNVTFLTELAHTLIVS